MSTTGIEGVEIMIAFISDHRFALPTNLLIAEELPKTTVSHFINASQNLEFILSLYRLLTELCQMTFKDARSCVRVACSITNDTFHRRIDYITKFDVQVSRNPS